MPRRHLTLEAPMRPKAPAAQPPITFLRTMGCLFFTFFTWAAPCPHQSAFSRGPSRLRNRADASHQPPAQVPSLPILPLAPITTADQAPQESSIQGSRGTKPPSRRASRVIGTLDKPTKLRPTIECPGGTFECVTSLHCDNVKNQEEDAQSWEGERAQKGDADSGDRGNPNRRGTKEKATSRNEEEASGSRIWEKATQVDGNNRRP
ncbi:hypothetical protein NDU88_003875 [Pleurodeles waltl]|uniref:Uncharacterized protein n=1 Tax=Pleurodeles waltl TaxID=8319 RepID=A0AAV7T6Q2_PLEWA|nr:hypothetical protein NDU88_003875 [Pleurodeles waltl]